MLLRNPVSSGSHWLACAAAIIATLFLWRMTRGDRSRRIPAMVFGFSMICLYAASGLFHALMLPPEELRLFQKLDQSCIYALIAGTYTPVLALLLRGNFRKWMLIGVWGLAFAGIACQWLFPKPPHSTVVGLYLGLGWFGFLGVFEYFRTIGWAGMKWAIAGGLFYTFGAVCELVGWPVTWPGVIQSHEVLHVADMLATACHVVMVVGFVLPYRHPLEIEGSGEPVKRNRAA